MDTDAPGRQAPDARIGVPPSSHEPSGEAMRRLLRAVRDLASARELEDIVDIVRHAARELVNADGATFVLRDQGQCHYVDEDAIEPLWRGQRFPLEACISGWAMINNQQVMISDIYLDDRIPHAAYRPTFVKSLAMTPIRAQEPVGSIGTYWAEERAATPAELEVLQALADSAAVAMESVRTLHELEDRVTERTAELEVTNRDLAAFAHLAAHDLKAPLTTIAGYAELLTDSQAGDLSDVGANAAETIHRQAIRMAGLIDAVLGYSTAATAPTADDPVDFNVLTAHVLADLEGLIAARGAIVSVKDLPSTNGMPHLLERVLQNLIANAILYGNPSSPVVSVTGSSTRDQVSVSVSDNGSGVPTSERDAIFDMFSRGTAAAQSAGSGIGLAFARRVVVRHGGTLVVTDAPGGGARFTLSLPYAEEQVEARSA